MESQGYSVARQIRALVNSARGRVLRGHYDFEKDTLTLQKYRYQARALNDPVLEAEAINVLAIMNIYSGHFNSALEQLWLNYDIYQQAGDVGGMVTSLNNLAAMHRRMADYTESIKLCDQGIDLASEFADRVEKHEIRNYGLLLTGKLTALVILHRYDEARHLFDELWAIADQLVQADRLAYARVMTYGHRGKAEVELVQGHLDEAKSAVKLALELAELLNLPLELSIIHFTQAHIALAGEQDEADAFWQKAEEVMATMTLSINSGWLYAEEAQYLSHEGYHDKAQYFARKAVEQLKLTRTPEVEQIIQSLSAMVNR
jgi:hypothetical protein